MELNEVITTEAAEAESKHGMNTGLVIDGSMVLGAVLYEHMVKPIGEKVFTGIANKLAARKAKKADAVNLDDMPMVDVPDID